MDAKGGNHQYVSIPSIVNLKYRDNLTLRKKWRANVTTRIVLVIVVLLGAAQIADAVVTFQQLDDNTFTVSHKVKWIGSRGQAMDLVFEKTASLCVAAGYTHMKILDQETTSAGYYQNANATLTVKFFLETGEGRVECGPKASVEYIEQSKRKLAKKGYAGPVPVDDNEEDSEDDNQCTVEQIAAMLKAGLSEEQIKAACTSEE